MKYRLIIALLLAATLCKGQRVISKKVDHVTYYPVGTWERTPAIDTIPVVMLVCDTSFINEWSIWRAQNHYVGWQFGYSVPGWNVTTQYLDADKRPLPKSIIVWMSKER